MSEPTASGGGGQTPGWDSDDTDGKKRGQWKSEYPPEARAGIRWEMLYLAVVFFASLGGVLWIVSKICPPSLQYQPLTAPEIPIEDGGSLWLSFLGAWIAGTLGGCSYGVKWMYHVVGRLRWHEDRRLWRLCSPHLSGVVSLFMVFLAESGLLQIFDKTLIQHPIRVMAFSFLVGYFSDKALAKMADVADTLFGGHKKEVAKQSEKQSDK